MGGVFNSCYSHASNRNFVTSRTMLLASIIILFSLLALGLLALLDRYDTTLLKTQVERRNNTLKKVEYYDAFADRQRAQRPAGQN